MLDIHSGDLSGARALIPKLQADLLLVHPPAFFDFRNRRDIYFPFLGTAGDVPITPLYEYFPIGFKMLQKHLIERGHTVKIANFSTILLRYPSVDLGQLISELDVRIIGIDLHWMVHVQGALGVAELIKRLRNDIPIIFGGISSTYFAEQLIQYPFIDMVMRGYDTLQPMDALLDALKLDGELANIPNLIWKTPNGAVRRNAFSAKPAGYGVGVDWSTAHHEEIENSLPILELLSTQNAGCAYNCGWCGGSRDAFRRIFETKRSMFRKSAEDVRREFESLTNADRYHFYAVGSYNESEQGMQRFLEHIARAKLRSISYEQFHLTPEPVLRRMATANAHTSITLSPESHDPTVAKLAGRGVYSNDEMERWIDKALEVGISNIDIWYFIGMPQQDEESIRGTVDYCVRLLHRFPGGHVNPMICPMIPFLDPASTFFEYPEKNGYQVFYRTVEEHRRGMERASIINRLNYQTRWLTRESIVYSGYKAIRDLMQAKADAKTLPTSWVKAYNSRLDDAVRLIKLVHRIDCIEDRQMRAVELEKIGNDIEQRNQEVFYRGVLNQALPISRKIGGRWFEEVGWPAEAFLG